MIVSQPAALVTKTRILDTAERMFGRNGFDATSLRDITAEAQVNLAAINYHFQSKDILIDAVIERRIKPVNQRRLEMLNAAGPRPTVEQILEAFLAPVMTLEVRPAVPLIGRALSNPNHFVERVYKRHLLSIVKRFSEALGKALPHLTPEERFWRMQFVAGSMAHILVLSDVLPMMSGHPGKPLNRQAMLERLIGFLAAGLRSSGASTATVKRQKEKRWASK